MKMKAMAVKSYGEAAIFEEVEMQLPQISADQVLIKIAASSVNTVDTMIKRMGKELAFSPSTPAILGMDVAGEIVEIGSNINQYSIGDEVYGCVGGLSDLQGTSAEFVAVDYRLIAHKPTNLSMTEAAALPLVGITAYEGLTRAHIKKGQKVLIHGGTGGVGHVAVQLAQYFGADVYATVGGEKQMGIVENYGAIGINYKTEKVEDYVKMYTNNKGFDVVFDSVGGLNMLKSFEAASLNGHVATTVSLCDIDLSLMHFKGLSLHVVFMLIPMLHNFKREQYMNTLSILSRIAEAGKLKPLLDQQQFTIEQINEAYQKLADKKAIGKIVMQH